MYSLPWQAVHVDVEHLCLDFAFDRKWDVSKQSPYTPSAVPCSLSPGTPLHSQQHQPGWTATATHRHVHISLYLEGLTFLLQWKS